MPRRPKDTVVCRGAFVSFGAPFGQVCRPIKKPSFGGAIEEKADLTSASISVCRGRFRADCFRPKPALSNPPCVPQADLSDSI